jgi:hypothetical protein
MKPRMKLPESVERELEGLSDADRFQKVMGRLVQVTPEQVREQERDVKMSADSGPPSAESSRRI